MREARRSGGPRIRIRCLGGPAEELGGLAEVSVDEVVDVLAQSLEELVRPLARQVPVVDGLVEPLLRLADQRILQAVDRLAFGAGDLCEGLSLLEPLAKRILVEPEVLSGCVEAVDEDSAVVTLGAAEERRSEQR